MRVISRVVLLLPLVCACATAGAKGPAAAVQLQGSDDGDDSPASGSVSGEALQSESLAPATVAMHSAAPRPASASPSPHRRLAQASGLSHQPVGGGAAEPAAREMLEIEGNLAITVESVAKAADALRLLVRQHGGLLTEDVEDQSGSSSARFTVRVDAARTDELLAALELLGHVRSRNLNARDIGKQFQDNEILLENLRVTMQRYEQILGRAESVSDILTIENELTRLRGQIEQVKGSLRWMQDRVARATIHVSLGAPREAEPPPIDLPHAKLYPGLRLAYAEDLRGNGVHDGYVGGGISIRANRAFSLDIDGLRRRGTGWPTDGIDVLLLTMGGETYSEFLGNGRRRFLNPYLGLRLGYARCLGHSEFAAGGTVGLELVKTRYVTADIDVRVFGLFGKSSHAIVQPAFGLSFAF